MLDLIVSYLITALAECLDAAIGFIMPVFGFDFDTFARAFPFAAMSYSIFQRIALAIVLLVAGWHLIPFLMSWFGIRTEQLRSNPIRQIGQAVIAVIAIYYGNYILSAIIDIAQLPFNALLFTNVDATWNLAEFEINPLIAALNDVFYQYSILLYLILLVLIGFSLIKVILEAVERYIVLYVLVYLSPLAAASLASTETSGIYSRFFSMFISQCLLLLLNIWSLKMAISLLANLGANGVPMLGLLMGYAFLRVAQKLDSYMNQLGLNAAITGAGLGAEMFATGALLMGKFGGMAGGRASAGTEGGSGGILGFGQKVAATYGRYNPLSAAADTVGAAASGVTSAFSDAVATGASTYRGTNGGFSQRISSAIRNGYAQMRSTSGTSVRESVDGVDNIVTRNMNNPRTNAAVNEMADPNMTITDEHHHLLSSNPYSAGKVFDQFQHNGHVTHESRDVSAVLQGIGFDKVPDVKKKDFINVGYGNTPAKNMDYRMDKGIHASYVKDGRQESLSVISNTQYNALPKEEQFAFQQFKSSNGSSFYYKTSSQKVEAAFPGGKKNPKPTGSGKKPPTK